MVSLLRRNSVALYYVLQSCNISANGLLSFRGGERVEQLDFQDGGGARTHHPARRSPSCLADWTPFTKAGNIKALCRFLTRLRFRNQIVIIKLIWGKPLLEIHLNVKVNSFKAKWYYKSFLLQNKNKLVMKTEYQLLRLLRNIIVE